MFMFMSAGDHLWSCDKLFLAWKGYRSKQTLCGVNKKLNSLSGM